MASAWGFSWGDAWGFSWGALESTSLREFEVDFEPHWRKALRLRKERKFSAVWESNRQRSKAHQIEIRAAHSALSDAAPKDIEAGLLAMYVEWLAYKPVITLHDATERQSRGDYATFLALVGELINRWQQDEEDAILALML